MDPKRDLDERLNVEGVEPDDVLTMLLGFDPDETDDETTDD